MPSTTISISASGDDQSTYGETGTWFPAYFSHDTAVQYVNTSKTYTGSGYFSHTGLLAFDTSGLPDNAVITSATLRVHVAVKNDTNSRSYVVEYYNWNGTSTDHTNTNSGNAHAGTPLASITVNQDNDFALSNLTNISTTGTTKLRTSLSGTEAPTAYNQLHVASVDHATLPEPRLIVEYVLPLAQVQYVPFEPATTSNSYTINFASSGAGNLGVVLIGGDKDTGTISVTTAGWTIVQSNFSTGADANTQISGAVAWKPLTAGETSVTFTFSTSRSAVGGFAEYSGLSSLALEGSLDVPNQTVAGDSLTLSSVGPTSAACLAVAMFCADSGFNFGSAGSRDISWSDGFTHGDTLIPEETTGSAGQPGLSWATKTVGTGSTVQTTASYAANPGKVSDQNWAALAVFRTVVADVIAPDAPTGLNHTVMGE